MICICRDGRVTVDASQKTGLWYHLIIIVMLYRVLEQATEIDEDIHISDPSYNAILDSRAFANLSSASWIGMTHNRQKS
jgi:hypothetical protein